ncbi:MAG: sugar phosphate nucleotidyltransferase, partial [Firmicutes bacterium]|nr:sugar phosphate nucleotidyltransferase [Bacillota bacterium]
MSNITKAVIPCGGLGTRFFPITKTVPKELLPIVDIPTVCYIINEAKQSGISDILIVVSPQKQSIKDFFLPNKQLMRALKRAGKEEEIDILRQISDGTNIVFKCQKSAKGSGDAVLIAKNFVGNQPFALAWGDDVVGYQNCQPPIMQLKTAFNAVKTHIVGTKHCKTDDIVKYGVAKIDTSFCPLALKAKQSNKIDFDNLSTHPTQNIFKASGFVEKPPLNQLPSR